MLDICGLCKSFTFFWPAKTGQFIVILDTNDINEGKNKTWYLIILLCVARLIRHKVMIASATRYVGPTLSLARPSRLDVWPTSGRRNLLGHWNGNTILMKCFHWLHAWENFVLETFIAATNWKCHRNRKFISFQRNFRYWLFWKLPLQPTSGDANDKNFVEMASFPLKITSK